MADSNVAVTFSARVDDFVGGVAEARDALDQFRRPFADLETQYAGLRGAMATAFDPARLQTFNSALGATTSLQTTLAADFAQASQAMRSQDQAAYRDAVRAAQLAISDTNRSLEDVLKDRLADYAEDARFHQTSEAQKVQDSKAAIEEISSAEADLLTLQGSLGAQGAAQRQTLQSQIEAMERRHQEQILSIQRQAETDQMQQYQAIANSLTGAFNSQISSLLRGTTTWRDAFRNMTQELLTNFIRFVETSVTQYVAGEAAKTTATVAGAGARASAEQAGAARRIGGASGHGSALDLVLRRRGFCRSVRLSRADHGAGRRSVRPWPPRRLWQASRELSLPPTSGCGTSPEDMLTLVHHNELIMPAAQAGAFRDLLSSGPQQSGSGSAVHIHPTTNFHVSAVNSGSVAQWMKANSATMMKSIDEAVRHGAHLGLRRLRAT